MRHWISYDLQFLPSALREGHKLGSTIRDPITQKPADHSEPRISGNALQRPAQHYKIKLRSSGYRLG